MKIIDTPREFQPNYVSDYPPYSSGKNTEEILYGLLKENAATIETEYIYIPIFWTSIYTMRNHNGSFDDLYNWLDTLDKSKKYFTIVQNDCGVFVRNFDLSILVFSAGGGGLNIKNGNTVKDCFYNGLKRSIFSGNTGDYDLPLMCLPLLQTENSQSNQQRDIFCSFIGRYDTHWCRIKMAEKLMNKKEYAFFESTKNIEDYKAILNRSVFTLAPRGFGYTSFRLFEALLSGSIPIYVWEEKYVLPYNEILDWSKIAITININDVDNLDEILR